MRLSWVQPEDLVGHELRQAEEDGRNASAIARRWLDAGGELSPALAGASPEQASPELRALAGDLLDELALLPGTTEPTDLAEIKSECPLWMNDCGSDEPEPDRVHGAWLGRAVGCLLGKPVEKIPRAGIEEIARATGNWPIRRYFTEVGLPGEIAARWPWNRRSRPTSLIENIDGMPEDDDLNYPLLALMLLERKGSGFTTEDVADLWLAELPAGRTFTAERIAYRNLLLGHSPPETASYRNPFREWIGAQIRADLFGWINPGRPGAAAEAAWRDAVLSHTANGVYGAMFVAAAVSAAAVLEEPMLWLRAGLSVVPPRSRLATAVRDAIVAAQEEEDWERVLDRLYDSHGHLHWVHAVNNCALVAAAVVHGRGDFEASICRVVAGGWDTDSNGATVGSLLGVRLGAASLPESWTAPLKNRLATTVGGMDGIGFDELAARTVSVAGKGI
ncbi:ADP-ribosylglycohydrolase family protein [Allokutzneria sp. A3M-2-11 16]|uniref:ADP-ribosylglycohydrolase family protein n=1 Tax=Allokutzneria sp. A3M-2-11 16 TaxID=2962043 RepID=UPI0020B75729|nr:ADP-ribosylglycohydrolase family protein [Allokutzneria sp. A3M-2-11 16]MCP3802105.1 ADP-ribosylglycohydrolase family protein [Allokutzneria sp. A3M-2-11 16]